MAIDLRIGCRFEILKKDIDLRIGCRFENLKKGHRSKVQDWVAQSSIKFNCQLNLTDT